MSHIPDNVKEQLEGIKEAILERTEEIKAQGRKDVEIDEFNIDESILQIPKLHGKWLEHFTEETINLKELFSLKEKVKLERWKYYMGKQENKYYAQYGILHEKILKTDVDKYLSADEKLVIVNDIVSAQKALVDYIERTMKEIGNRGFHCKSIIDWRRFTAGG